MTTGNSRPLEGLRVIDLTRALAGPYATLLLAGLGAQVIKVEDPKIGDLARENSPYVGRSGITIERQFDDDLSVSHLTRSRGKYGVSLNLKAPGAAGVFQDLVRVSDIVVENFTSGTADRLGIGYEVAKAANPKIIYCSLSGFGANHREGSKAMDVLIQALSGAMYTSGGPGEPPVRIGVPMADLLAPVFSVIGILSALHQRERTGLGQQVDVSMLGALTSFVAIENWAAMSAVGMSLRTGMTMPRLSPFGVFACQDGFIALVAVQDALAHGLFRAMGQPEMSEDVRFSNRNGRVANSNALEDRVTDWLRTKTVSEALALLNAHGVPAAQVRHPEEAVTDPLVTERGETIEVVHPTYPAPQNLWTSGVPVLFSQADTGFDDVLPVSIGQHNQEIYGSLLGYDAHQLQQLKSGGVI